MASEKWVTTEEQSGITLAAFLRSVLPDHSWSMIRRVVETRRVKIDDELCLDQARRLRPDLTIELLSSSAPKKQQQTSVTIRYVDEHVVVVEKPSGLCTVRHPSERQWKEKRKSLSPTLEDIVPRLIAQGENRSKKAPLPRLRIVHRLDKATSGLVVFARTVEAERGLGRQFHAHTVTRRYMAVVPGFPQVRTIRTFLVRDRGDGRRGSTSHEGEGKEAITHIEPKEWLGKYTIVECRLETGRTHQIRIHLAEQGHPVCGESVYLHRVNAPPLVDTSGAPRLALHAAELGFEHPVTGEQMSWTMPMPKDLSSWVNQLRREG